MENELKELTLNDIPNWALNSACDVKFAERHIRDELAECHFRTGEISYQDKGSFLVIWAWNKRTVICTEIDKQS